MEIRTDHLGKWLKRAGFMEGMRDHRAFVTSTEWAEIAAEVEALNLASDKPIISQPTNKNFRALRLMDGRLTLVNSGSESQDFCDTMNRMELGIDADVMRYRAQQLFPQRRLDDDKVKHNLLT